MRKPWDAIHRTVIGAGGEIDFGGALTPGVMPYLEGTRRILDFGCGHGNDAIRLARAGFEVTGLDVSASALQRACERSSAEGLEIEFVEVDAACGLPFEAASFEAVLANLSLHYFDLEHTRFILGDVSRVLVPGGVLATHVNSTEEGVKRLADGKVIQELEPGFYLESNGVTRRYFDRAMLEHILAAWDLIALETVEIHSSSKEAKHCWRAVARAPR